MLNQTIIQGRLCADPVAKVLPSGSKTCAFCVACDRPKNKNGEVITDFINCVIWGHQATFLEQYFNRGDMIIVGGRLQTRAYQDANGIKKTVTELCVNQVEFAGKKTSAIGNDWELPDFI